MACQSIRQGECSAAIAGGVNLQLSPEYYVGMSRMKVHSPTGQCYAFDDRADGIVLGEGAGAVLLKPLAQAVADGDRVYGVIKGSAVNNDGRTNGLTAPNPASQADVIRTALDNAGVSAETISYVEAHGTGTTLGDPIEVEGLSKAFRVDTDQDRFCAIGSVKTNLGHLESAAGIAQSIKVLLSLQHQQLPPSLNFECPNPYIPFENSPFVVNDKLQAWESKSTPRRAGVSSFGMGGTNAHVVVEEAPTPQEIHNQVDRSHHLLMLAAKSEQALAELVDRYHQLLTNQPDLSLADLCFTANTGRVQFNERLGIVTDSISDLTAQLTAYRQQQLTPNIYPGSSQKKNTAKIAYLFTGQGSLSVRMGRQLYETQPTFRQAIAECAVLMEPHLDQPLLSILYPVNGQNELIDRTIYTQPALFALEYALFKLWQSWGITPDAVLGHSLGEYVAAVVAGVMSLADGIKLVTTRARLMQNLPTAGEMVAVFATPADIQKTIEIDGRQLTFAVYNSPENTVIAGDKPAISHACEALAVNGIGFKPLDTTNAFHSPLMEPMLPQFQQVVTSISYSLPQIPLISNLTGTQVDKIDAEYWCQQLRQSVRFADGIQALAELDINIFLEIGPKPTLLAIGQQCLPVDDDRLWLSSLWGIADGAQMLHSLAQLAVNGVEIDWSGFDRDYHRQRVPLPTYPFQRQSYWIATAPESAQPSPDKPLTQPAPFNSHMAHNKNEQYQQILTQLHIATAQMLKANLAEIDIDAPFLEMGADSLVLTEAVSYVGQTYGLKIGIRQLFEELTTVAALAGYIDRQLPAVPGSVDIPAASAPSPLSNEQKITTPAIAVGDTALERIMQQQMQLVSDVIGQQLAVFKGSPEQSKTVVQSVPKNPSPPTPVVSTAPTLPAIAAQPPQPEYLQQFIAEYTKQTATSKAIAQSTRSVLADSRASAGFRPSTKELVYPIIGDRAIGSRIWDVDGNEYIDLTMGFGVLLFGHAPKFIHESLIAQLDRGLQIGPQAKLAGEVARLITELTGTERAAFCNSGTEAVMTALRLARTATGRHKIALFADSYHGHFDGILAKANAADGSISPSAAGIPAQMVADVLVLEYGDPASLEILRANATELAAVLVEPVQSRHPELQPREFLHQLRQLTSASGTALIFDEVLIGFRIHQGGAQAWFDIQADILTYGKIVGGGLPIGVVAGKSKFLDGIDGGYWNYGDASYPAAEKTFFAGTFNKNHLGMVVARATLQYLKAEGPSLQAKLNQKTHRLAITLNDYFNQMGVPMQVVHFGSLFRFSFNGNFDLFFYHLLAKGIYVWEGRSCFLSTAHTDADIDRVIRAVQESVDELYQLGTISKIVSQSAVSKSTSGVVGSPQLGHQLNPEEPAPLSFAQQRLWFLAQLEPNSALYNLPVAVSLHGQLQVDVLTKCIQSLIQRHAVLRTNFLTQADGQAQQVVHPHLSWQMEMVDLQSVPHTERADEILRFSHMEAEHLFNLENEPLIRAKLLVLTPTEHLLLLTLHHIVADGWSTGIFLTEITALYPAFLQGLPSPLPELEIQYADFALWQRQWLQGEVLEHQLAYWQQQLANAPTLLELPSDRPRPPAQSFQGARYACPIPESIAAGISTISSQNGVTPFMTLLAAFDVLLYRYTGQTDILVGSPIANRNHQEIENLIGFFVNTLVLRGDLAGNPTFRELVTKVKKMALDAYTHQDLPFEMLVERIHPERGLSHTPLFQVTFSLENDLMGEIDLPDLKLKPVELDTSTAKFDLSLILSQTTKGLLGVWEYNTDLFDTSTIQRMAEHFQVLLAGIVANPNQQISTLPLLTAPEQQQLLWDWNNTQTDYPQDLCVHQLFERQVQKTPTAIAVVYKDQRLTYEELNHRANQLARHLQQQQIESAAIVGICVERSIDPIVSVLAVWKVGAAYVPLDPTYPPERLQFMLADAGVDLILTQPQLAAELSLPAAQVVNLEPQLWVQVAAMSTDNLELAIPASNLANIIYTSGSTGIPKGVMVPHQGLCNLAQAQIELFQVQPTSKVLQFASFSFDAAISEILMALGCGASLFIDTKEALLPGEALSEYLQARAITHVTLPPAALAVLPGQPLPHLKTTIVAGEACPPALIRQWSAGRNFFNAYGPTEGTVCATVSAPLDGSSQSAPIGRPIPNVQVYILDGQLQPMPVGVAGELHIGGIGVTRGYLNRPELTAAKFIANPFTDDRQSRLYKTGDLARYLPDGNIEYLGRIDQQVKIRGFRIELGEIAAAISKQPSVSQVTVIDREDIPGNKQLVAYVVPQSGKEISSTELRTYLSDKLPGYMVPAAIVSLDALPLTPNGKVDRQALPIPDFAQSQSEEYVAPRNEVEEILVDLWTEVLGVDRVGIYDNFFTLGGHSLLATQMISRVRQTFAVEVPLRVLFTANTVATLAAQIQGDRADESIISKLPLTPVSRTENLPLSFAQKRLWFLDRLEPNSSAYNMPGALRLQGQLDLAALEKTLCEIIRRHEALRTNFISQDGQPAQIIHQSSTWQMTVIDLQHLPVSEREEKIQQLATAEAEKPFALDTDSLMRATLLLVSETEQILLLTMHHIVSDGWSIGLLVSEIAALYVAFITGESSPLPELEIQYVDFAVWQRQWLQGETLERQLNYWQQQLVDAPALLELPTDRPRPPVQTFHGATYESVIPAQLAEALEKLTQQEEVTLFMTLLTAFDVLLYRYTGQVDILVGSPIANRNHREIENLIGFFVNTLVLRSDLAGDPTFRALLQRVREVCLGAYAHQDLPFEMLVETLQPERNLSHSPLFQVMFILQNTPISDLELPGVTLSPVKIEGSVSPFDLTLSLDINEKGSIANWEYNTDLFDALTIERMAEQFQILLAGIIANPDRQISALPILSAAEQQQLLWDWNNTQTDYPQDLCIHQLFERQVQKTPQVIALVTENQQLTYQELNQRANQLAHHLQTLEVKPEMLVGLCMERSPEMIVAMLAILKAGGAYVPLDPDYPPERLAYMVADAQIPVLLTQERLLSQLPINDAQIVCLDRDWPTIGRASSKNLAITATPEHLAYVIYTSGSTGQPKGVTISQQNLVNFCLAAISAYEITSTDRILQFASVSFDVAAEEIYPGLMQGATIYVRTAEMLNSAKEFWHQCQTWELTLLDLPTAYWQQLISIVNSSNQIPTSVRLVIIGGERANPAQVRLWQNQVGTYPQLINAYGPTEATVEATCCNLTNVKLREGQEVPIGKPLANVQAYILDARLQLVPLGVAGELHIGGQGIARGYLNRPELTAAKFIAHPFSDDPQARLYKTGDLVRYLPDGNIEYLGRIDQQVKIRGFRIELGEVEAAIGQHPQVSQVTVIAREDTPANKCLVAYVVPQSAGAQISSAQIRTFLHGKLPDYMLPAVVVCLERLPLTPNGKVDRPALPIPDFTQELSAQFVAPRNDTEEILANIWGEVLGVNPIGIHDNFFALGGHSLLATQLTSRMREAFDIEIPLKRLFEANTIALLATEIEGDRFDKFSAIPLTHVSRNRQLPLSFAQQRLWFLDRLDPNSSTYNIPEAVKLCGQLDIIALGKTFNEIIRRHEVLRTNFFDRDGQAIVQICATEEASLTVINIQNLGNQADEIASLVVAEAQKPFDLAHDPLIRFTLIEVAATEHILLLTMHHIISDGWSIGILIREIGTLYEAYIADRTSPLPELDLQYVDFAVWQRQWLQGETLERQLNYWQQQLADVPTLLELPTDRPRPPVQTFNGASYSYTIPASLTADLNQLTQQEGVTLFMTLLAAFDVLLYRYTGQPDVLVGSPIANRNHSEIEGLIGFFVNTLALRNNLAGDPTFRELLQRVREVCLGAYAHQDLPFEMLVERVQPERNLSHSPLFQVMFILQNAPVGESELPNLQLLPLDITNTTAKFDLILSVEATTDSLVGTWEYNTDLFDAETIDRMAVQFETLLMGIVTDPDQSVSTLPLLTATEQQQLLWDWNATQTNDRQDLCIHQLFEQQVAQTPQAVAVVDGEEQLTYQELNHRANQLAHYLKGLGVQTDTLIGLGVEPSGAAIIGILGILKAGGAYVPLDPNYPAERLHLMLSTAQVSVLLTQEALLARFPADVPVVCLDRDWPTIANSCQDNLDTSSDLERLGYVIYTSGSTGLPKGVAMPQRALVNLIQWQMQQSENASTTLQFAPLSFDVSFQEILSTVCAGGTLVLIAADLRRDPWALLNLITAQAIERLFLPVVALQQLAATAVAQSSYPPQLRAVITAGEQLQITPEIAQFFRHLPGCRLHNHYGPSETHVVTALTLPVAVDDWATLPAIGRPIDNTQIYLLTPQLQPVPIGVPGELYIGGDSLARGYWHRPDLTVARFIPDPFSARPAALLYQTGDLARYLPDGNIQYLGRLDAQVKIRGFRIELGEVEAATSQHPQVSQVIVIASADAGGHQQLVAYVVPRSGAEISSVEVKTFLQGQLPSYLVPAAVVCLAQLPLTPSGKVDRQALPVPDRNSLDLNKNFVPPLGTIERQLAEIWSEILAISPIGRDDDFFELGGHSLLAVQLMARIQHQFDQNLPLATLFQYGNIKQFAELIRQPSNNLNWSQLVPIKASGTNPPFFCVPGAGGNPIYFYNLAHYLGEDQPFYGFQSLGLDGRSTPHQRVEEMATDYIQSMKSVQPQGPYFLGGHSFGGRVAFEMANQLHQQGEKVALLAILDTNAPLDESPAIQEERSKLAQRSDVDWLTETALLMGEIFGQKIELDREVLQTQDPDAQLQHFYDCLQVANILPPGTDTSQLRGLVQVYQSEVTMFCQPSTGHSAYPDRIDCFIADANEDMPDSLKVNHLGWGRFSTQPIESYVLPGNHLSMLRPPHVKELAAQLRDCIESRLLTDRGVEILEK